MFLVLVCIFYVVFSALFIVYAYEADIDEWLVNSILFGVLVIIFLQFFLVNELAVIKTTTVATPLIKLDEKYYVYSYESATEKEVVISTKKFFQTKIKAIVIENDDVVSMLKTTHKGSYNEFLDLFMLHPDRQVVEVPTGTVNRIVLED